MFLLKIKVTVLFVIFMIPMLLSGVIVIFEGASDMKLLRVAAAALGYAFLLIWILSIFNILFKKGTISAKKYIWQIIVIINILSLLGIALLHIGSIVNFADGYLVFIVQYGLCFLLYSIIEVSISLRKYELGRNPSFEEWFVQAVCFFFYPLGVWLIQPKLNKMTELEA